MDDVMLFCTQNWYTCLYLMIWNIQRILQKSLQMPNFIKMTEQTVKRWNIFIKRWNVFIKRWNVFCEMTEQMLHLYQFKFEITIKWVMLFEKMSSQTREPFLGIRRWFGNWLFEYNKKLINKANEPTKRHKHPAPPRLDQPNLRRPLQRGKSLRHLPGIQFLHRSNADMHFRQVWLRQHLPDAGVPHRGPFSRWIDPFLECNDRDTHDHRVIPSCDLRWSGKESRGAGLNRTVN